MDWQVSSIGVGIAIIFAGGAGVFWGLLAGMAIQLNGRRHRDRIVMALLGERRR